jgi:prophage regulatory protein
MKLLRLGEVIEMTGLSRATIYRYEDAGEFPKRRRTGPNSVRWLDEDVIKWMKSRPPASEGLSVLARNNSVAGLNRKH